MDRRGVEPRSSGLQGETAHQHPAAGISRGRRWERGIEPPRAASKAAMLPVTSAPIAALVRDRESNSVCPAPKQAGQPPPSPRLYCDHPLWSYRRPWARGPGTGQNKAAHPRPGRGIGGTPVACVTGATDPLRLTRSAMGMTARPRDDGRRGRWCRCLAFTELPPGRCVNKVRCSVTREQRNSVAYRLPR